MESNRALQVVETYLRNLYSIYIAGAGLSEAAYYPPLADLLNEIGRTLQPNVRCLLHFKRMSANLPDGGLFTADQFASPADYNSLPRTPPARGVVLVKSPGEPLIEAALDQTIARHLKRYGQVLITNYHAFVTVRGERKEAYSLIQEEAQFWRAAAKPEGLAAKHGPLLVKYLAWVMRFSPPAQPAKSKRAVQAPLSQTTAPAVPSSPSLEGQRDLTAPATTSPASPSLGGQKGLKTPATTSSASPDLGGPGGAAPALQTSHPQPDYFLWPHLVDLFPTYFPGIRTGREPDLSDIDLDRLEGRMQAYFDRTLSHEAAARVVPHLMTSGRDFEAAPTRRQLLERGLASGDFIKYAYRAFDLRHFYSQAQLLDERQKAAAAVAQANHFLVSRKKAGKDSEGAPCYFVSALADRYLFQGVSVSFPITLKGRLNQQQSLFEGLPDHVPTNLSALAHKYLVSLGLSTPDADEETASLLARHVLAISYAPLYQQENEVYLCHDWPRFPLPDSLVAIRKSATLGTQLMALLDPEASVPQVTELRHARPDLKTVGLLTAEDEEEIDPDEDLALLTAWNSPELDGEQWVEREFTPAERAAIEKGAASLGLTLDQLDEALGLTTCDLYLNRRAYWANIPLKVWEFRIGGHQVLKGWLAARQANVLGRPLKLQEAQEFTQIARRLMAIILLGPALDRNYRAVKQEVYSVKSKK